MLLIVRRDRNDPKYKHFIAVTRDGQMPFKPTANLRGLAPGIYAKDGDALRPTTVDDIDGNDDDGNDDE